MQIELISLIVPGMASAIATMAVTMWRREVAKTTKLEKQNDRLIGIVVSRAAKTDETVAEFAEYLKANEGGS